MNDIQHLLADNLRIYRKWKGLSQEKLGELCGLHRTYIGGIEQQNTNVSVLNIQKIARALKINPALLFVEQPTNVVNAAKSKIRIAQDAIADLGFKPGSYALCYWHDDEILLEPVPVIDPSLAVDILVVLIEQGFTDDLPDNFKHVQQRIIDYAATQLLEQAHRHLLPHSIAHSVFAK